MKKKINLIYGITFLLSNIVIKNAIYGTKRITINNMPMDPPNFVQLPSNLAQHFYDSNDILNYSVKKLIPFLIVGGLITIAYEIAGYKTKVLDKKWSFFIPLIIYVITELILLYLFFNQYQIVW